MACPAKKKRTVTEENRQFNEAWTEDFLVVELPNKAGMSCLECGFVIKTMKRYNAQIHFIAKHSAQYAQMSQDVKKARVATLITNRRAQQSMIRSTATGDINKKATLAGFKIVHSQ